MNLGLAIFLSSIILGLIFLFNSTKDRWNWKRIFMYSGIILFSLILLSSIYYFFFFPSINSSYQKPYKSTELWEIKLGDSPKDVIFLKGYPDELDSLNSIWYYKHKHYTAYNKYYIYEQYELIFNKDKVSSILYLFDERDYYFPPNLFGRTFNGYKIKGIKDYLGEPTNFTSLKDGLTRVYFYSNYDALFYLKENKVFGYGIYNPEYKIKPEELLQKREKKYDDILDSNSK
jgi:hypothetical protein